MTHNRILRRTYLVKKKQKQTVMLTPTSNLKSHWTSVICDKFKDTDGKKITSKEPIWQQIKSHNHNIGNQISLKYIRTTPQWLEEVLKVNVGLT